MPPLPAVPNVLAVRYQFQLDSGALVSAKEFFTYSGGAPSNATCDALAVQLYPAWTNHLLNRLASAHSFLGCTVTDLSSSTGGFGSQLITAAGTDTGNPVASSVCTLVSLSIARRYRGGKPRKYYPLGTLGDILNDREWSSTYVSNVATGYAAFITAATAVSEGGTTIVSHVNVSYYEGFTPVLNPVTGRTKDAAKPRVTPLVDPITNSVVSPIYGAQRRRVRPR